jgi:hypothetical protein
LSSRTCACSLIAESLRTLIGRIFIGVRPGGC